MNRIPAWDGSAEKWTEHENEVLCFEQSLKPSERPQLVLLAKTLSSIWGFCNRRLESFQSLIPETSLTTTSSD